MKATAYTAVELEADCLEMVAKIGRRFSDPNPYWEKALAIKARTLK